MQAILRLRVTVTRPHAYRNRKSNLEDSVINRVSEAQGGRVKIALHNLAASKSNSEPSPQPHFHQQVATRLHSSNRGTLHPLSWLETMTTARGPL